MKADLSWRIPRKLTANLKIFYGIFVSFIYFHAPTTGDGFECALIDCGAPADVPHGIVTGERHNLDDVVHFSCVKGYELVGQEERTCLEDGLFFHSPRQVFLQT